MSTMRIENVQQNTPEWLAWRESGLGGSDAPVIMEASPWQTRFGLWSERMKLVPRDEKRGEYVKAKGHKYEPRARALYELQHDVDMPATCGRHATQDCLLVSLDGYNRNESRALEIKLVGKEDFKLIQSRQIPPKYVPQIYHQHMVGDVEEVDLCGYNEEIDDIAVLRVVRDRRYEAQLFERELAFWDMIQKGEPPALSARDRRELKDKDSKALVNHYLKLLDKIAKAEQKLKTSRAYQSLEALKAELAEADEAVKDLADAGAPLVECQGLKVTRFYTKGTIDWASIPLPPEINPEKYRKVGRFSTRITPPKS